MKLIIAASLSFLCIVGSAVVADAAERHVSLSGNDRAIGTESSPFRTIARAISVAVPGDEILLHEGVWQPQRPLYFGRPGTSERPIVMRAFQDGTAVIDGSRTPADTDLISVGTAFIRIEGLTIRNAKRNGIVIYGPGSRVNNNSVSGNHIHHCDLSGVYAGTKTFDDPVRNVVIENNRVHDTSTRNLREKKQSWSFGVGAGLGLSITIRGNTVHNTHGESIGLYLTKDSIIEANRVSDGFSVDIYLDNTSGTTVARNFVFNTGKRSFNRFNRPPVGIQIANENYGGLRNPAEGNKIIGNIVVDSSNAISYGAYQIGGGLRNTLIAHNTCVRSTGSLLRINDDKHANTVIVNNLFVQAPRRQITEVTGSADGLTFQGNLWSGGLPPRSLVKHNSDASGVPQFVNEKSNDPKDFQLTPQSPGSTNAIDNDQIKFRFDGTFRKNKSLGAW